METFAFTTEIDTKPAESFKATSQLEQPSEDNVSARLSSGKQQREPKSASSVVPGPSGKHSKTLSRSRSQLLREAAFGDDDDLSDISDSPIPAPKNLRRHSTSLSLVPGRLSFEPTLALTNGNLQSTAHLGRGVLGARVIDSDDDAPPAPPVQRRRVARRVLRHESTIDNAVVEDCRDVIASLAPVEDHSTSRPNTRSRHNEARADQRLLRFSGPEIPAPDFNAPFSSPSIVPNSTLKSALVKKLTQPEPADQDAPQTSPLPLVPTSTAVRTRSSAIAVFKANLDALGEFGHKLVCFRRSCLLQYRP